MVCFKPRQRLMRLRCLVSLLTLLMLITSPVAAHQKKTAITTILFNARSGNIEVMHRFLVHDAEHAVKQIREMRTRANILESETTRAAFSQYVAERFFLYDENDALLELTLLGSEIDGSSIWVYQEIPIPERLDALTVWHNALRDIWFEQVNRVNIERNKQTDTLIFEGNVDRLSIDLE